MSYALSFKDLEAYKLAREISFEIFNISKLFPAEEKYSLTDQISRSSRSIGAQIAESWGNRRYEKHFISKLTDADSEHFETQHYSLELCPESFLLNADLPQRHQSLIDGVFYLLTGIFQQLQQALRKHILVMNNKYL